MGKTGPQLNKTKKERFGGAEEGKEGFQGPKPDIKKGQRLKEKTNGELYRKAAGEGGSNPNGMNN